MKLIIKIDKKPFGKWKITSERAFNEDKVVIVEFPNCISKTNNKPFLWLPTYEQLKNINEALNQVESINKKNEV